MSSKPTLVLIPGSWHSASAWDKVVPLLEAQQYKCVAVALPSASANPSATFEGDIEAVRNAIVAETTRGHDVVVVAHSFGGQVGNSAIKGLARNKQDAPASKKNSGHVVGLVLIASGFTMTGVGVLEGFGGQLPPWWKPDLATGLATVVVDPRELFYHDLPKEEGNHWVSKLTKQSLKSFTEGGEHSYSGWMDVPTWYLETTEDKVLPVQAQMIFVQVARDAGGKVTLREIESSHSPMLSRPKDTVDIIMEAAAAFVG